MQHLLVTEPKFSHFQDLEDLDHFENVEMNYMFSERKKVAVFHGNARD